jgi:hypothetical protein
MGYLKRFADTALQNRLGESGAVLIQGAKGCGKTETAVQAAKSVARLDTDDEIRTRIELDPKSALAGPVPRLLDEMRPPPNCLPLPGKSIRKKWDLRRCWLSLQLTVLPAAAKTRLT